MKKNALKRFRLRRNVLLCPNSYVVSCDKPQHASSACYATRHVAKLCALAQFVAL